MVFLKPKGQRGASRWPFLILNNMDMEIKINKHFKALIPPLLPDELSQLEANILRDGIRDPLVVWKNTIDQTHRDFKFSCPEYRKKSECEPIIEGNDFYCDHCAQFVAPGQYEYYLIDGHNRYEIALKHGLEFEVEELEFEDEDEVKEWMILHQFGRRNLSSYQRSVLALKLEDVFRVKAKENLKIYGGNQHGGPLHNSAKVQNIDTRKEVAKIANVSHDTIARVKKIEEKAPEEVKEKLASGEVSINEVYQEIRKEEKKQQRIEKIEEVKKRINEDAAVGIDKKYHAICIDPPWAYEEKGGFTANEHDSDSNRGGVDYPTMTVQQIREIELPAANDCVLFLWTTHAFLENSFSLLRDWGFQYKATLVWDKEKMGIGRTVRMQLEFCLLGVKGNPIIQGASERDIIREARREHSRKPNSFYDMVDRMCIGNKLDYFSRENRENWDTYGAETNKF